MNAGTRMPDNAYVMPTLVDFSAPRLRASTLSRDA